MFASWTACSRRSLLLLLCLKMQGCALVILEILPPPAATANPCAISPVALMQSVLFLFPETIEIYHVVSDCGLIYLLAGCKVMPLCTEDVYTAHCISSTRHIKCEHYIQPLFKSYLCKEEKNEREREHERETCARARKGARQRERVYVCHCVYSQSAKSYLRKERESAYKRESVCERECVCACIQTLRAYIAMIYVRGGERGERDRESARSPTCDVKHVSRAPRFQHQQPGHSMRAPSGTRTHTHMRAHIAMICVCGGESGEREGEREREGRTERERARTQSCT